MALAVTTVLALGSGRSASARAGDLRLALGGGMAMLRPQGQATLWGGGGGAKLGIAVADLAWLEILGDLTRLASAQGPERLRVVAAVLGYQFDVSWVSPFFEVGPAVAWLFYGDGRPAQKGFVPLIGLGVDFTLSQWLFAGVVARYYPLLGSSLTGEPAYATFQARLGVYFLRREAWHEDRFW